MKSYFNFNRKEKLGVLVLSGLILVLTVVLNVGASTYVPDPFDVDQSKLDFLVLNQYNNESVKLTESESTESDNNNFRKPVYKNFDPNKIELKDWKEMGFSEKQAQSILNYRNNYGPFKKKTDIQKLYVVSDEKYAELESYIQIKEIPNSFSNKNDYPEKIEEEATIRILEINTASKEELISLSGIGPTFADRILTFRSKIGGFVDPEQIDELYISDDAKVVLKQNTIMNTDNIQKTNVNTASKDELRKTPYSNWATVAAILKQRGQRAN